MYTVMKRDGKVVAFELSKISAAIRKAFEAQGAPYNTDIIDLLSLKVTADYTDKVKDGVINVEAIQDSVEKVLSEAGYADVAKCYILYRKQREKIRNMKSTILDYKEIVDNYVHVRDWRVKENSTVTYSVGGLILSNSGAITANYWLSEIYDEEIAKAHREADIHIHDLSMLTAAVYGVAMGNADEVIRSQCPIVTQSHEDHGVACAIRALLKDQDLHARIRRGENISSKKVVTKHDGHG